jgi:hypothetical protein
MYDADLIAIQAGGLVGVVLFDSILLSEDVCNKVYAEKQVAD